MSELMEIPRAPEGVSLTLNMQIARHKKQMYKYARGSLLWYWFYHQVRNGGPWDYKQRNSEFQNFGNFQYGAVGAAAGFSAFVLHRAAGFAQFRAETTADGVTWPDWFVYPHGDDTVDQEYIAQGIRYAFRQPHQG